MDLFKIFMTIATCCYISGFLFITVKSLKLDMEDVVVNLVFGLFVTLPVAGIGLAVNGKDFFNKEGNSPVIILGIMIVVWVIGGIDSASTKERNEHIDKVNQRISDMDKRLSDMESAPRTLKR